MMFNNRKIYWFFLSFGCFSSYWVFVSNSFAPKKIVNTNFKNKSNIGENSNYCFDRNHYYVAAVIDYSAIFVIDYNTQVLQNLQRYISIVNECKTYMVDIVVFPECGLYDCQQMNRNTVLNSAIYVPSPTETIIPCRYPNAGQTVLHNLSCAARYNEIYVVVDVMEKYCGIENPTCLENELLLYNTQVVFDRNGMIIARYRKFNLYTERWQYGLNQTEKPEISIFTTDFNVEFGLMICFDIMFTNPGLSLVKQYNITHIIHSAAMMSRLPFLAVTSLESGWSYSTNTILLTSTLPQPSAILGTNIYFGRRQYTQTYVKYYGFSKIIISPVPKILSQELPQYPPTFDGLTPFPGISTAEHTFLQEHVIRDFIIKPMFTPNFESKANFTYISDTFKCTINVTWIQPNVRLDFPNYQLMAYSGPNNYSIASINSYAEICGLALCSSGDITICKLPPEFNDATKITITSLNISATSRFPNDLRIPATLGSNLLALNSSLFEFDSFVSNISDNEAFNIVDMKLIKPSSGIVAFGIYKFFEAPKPISYFSITDAYMNGDEVSAN